MPWQLKYINTVEHQIGSEYPDKGDKNVQNLYWSCYPTRQDNISSKTRQSLSSIKFKGKLIFRDLSQMENCFSGKFLEKVPKTNHKILFLHSYL